MSYEFLNAGVTFLLSVVLTGITIGICRAKGWVFLPRADRWSTRAVAKCGGLAVIASFLLASIWLPHIAAIRSVLALTAAMALLGFWDDVKPLKPTGKLVIQVMITAAAVFSGVVYPVGDHYWMSVAVSAFWIVGITNGFNLLDNMDGLSAGVAAIAVLNLYFLVHSSTLHATVLLSFAGALLGFLVYNFHPAKIFMGDTGSLAIGFFVSCMAILETQHISQTASVLIAPVLLMFLPIFDTALVSVTRRLNGRAINAGARDHSSHRLVLLGLSERAAVTTLYALSAMGGVAAYLCIVVWPKAGFGLILLFLIASMLFWLYLAQLQLPESWLSRTNVATLALPEVLVSLSLRALVMSFDSVLFGVSLYLGFVLRFDHIITSLSLFCSVWALSILTKLPLLSLFGAYRNAHSATTLKDLYPIAKSAVLSFLIMATVLEFFLRDAGVPRAVLATDVILTCCLLVIFRVANRFFSDLLPGRTDRESCILVGNGSAAFYQHLFNSELKKTLRAVVIASPATRLEGISVQQLPFGQLSYFLGDEQIAHVYVLPDCPPEYEEALLELCGALECKVSSLRVQSMPIKAQKILRPSELHETVSH